MIYFLGFARGNLPVNVRCTNVLRRQFFSQLASDTSEITVNGRNIELILVPRAGAIRARWRVALYRGKANQIPMIPN